MEGKIGYQSTQLPVFSGASP